MPTGISGFALSNQPRSYNNLLGYVRRLFDWIVCQQFLASSPLRSGTHPQTARRLPYLFSPETIRRLLALAGTLPDNARAQLRGATYEMIFALLAGLGLRVSEVACLQWGDVDWERDLLEIRDTKFGRIGWYPLVPGCQPDYTPTRLSVSSEAIPAPELIICFPGMTAPPSARTAFVIPFGTICYRHSLWLYQPVSSVHMSMDCGIHSRYGPC